MDQGYIFPNDIRKIINDYYSPNNYYSLQKIVCDINKIGILPDNFTSYNLLLTYIIGYNMYFDGMKRRKELIKKGISGGILQLITNDGYGDRCLMIDAIWETHNYSGKAPRPLRFIKPFRKN